MTSMKYKPGNKYWNGFVWGLCTGLGIMIVAIALVTV